MLQNYNFYKVLSLFLDNPTKSFGWRELSKTAKLGPASVRKYLIDMKKEDLIVSKIVTNRVMYFANRESRKFKIFQTFHMLIKLENSGVADYLNKFYGFPTIILLGSYSTGEATEESDIDIAVITESSKYANLEEFEKKLKKQIQLFVFSKTGLEKLKTANPSLYNGIINGRVICGRLDVA